MEIVRPARDDYGATVTFTMRKQDETVLDLSTATAVQGYLVQPDGTVVSKEATKVGDGSTGQIVITFDEDDLDQNGEYILEPDIIFATAQYGGTPHRFTVRPSARG